MDTELLEAPTRRRVVRTSSRWRSRIRRSLEVARVASWSVGLGLIVSSATLGVLAWQGLHTLPTADPHVLEVVRAALKFQWRGALITGVPFLVVRLALWTGRNHAADRNLG
jgi:hypothetical protein